MNLTSTDTNIQKILCDVDCQLMGGGLTFSHARSELTRIEGRPLTEKVMEKPLLVHINP